MDTHRNVDRLPQRPPETIYPREQRTTVVDQRAEQREESVTSEVVEAGSSLEALGGAAGVVLAILGLAGFRPAYMAPIATIVVGAALIIHGGALASRWKDLVNRTSSSKVRRGIETDIGTEAFGGLIGVVLGILALAGVMPGVLLPIAMIVIGGSLLLEGSAESALINVAPSGQPARYERVSRDAVEAARGVMLLVGIGAVVLGILGLLRIGPPLTLTLVSLLGIGGALLLGGGALTARFAHRYA